MGNNLRDDMKKSETEYLTKQNEDVQTIARERTTKVKNFKNVEIEPILKRMADSLLQQGEELRNLETSVTLDVQNMVKTVNTFSVEVVENVTSLKNSVDEYATTNDTRVKSLMTKNQDIQKSEDTFKSLLDALMSSYAEHSKLVTENTKAIDQSSAKDLVAAKNLVDQSKDITEKVSDKRNQTFAMIEEENVRISEYVKISTKKCEDLNVAIGKENSDFELTVNKHVEENKASWKEVVEGTKTKVETQSKLMAEKNTLFNEAVDENKTDINIVGDSVKEFIEETKNTDSAGVACVVDSVGDLSLIAKKLATSLQSKITQEKETVSSFVTDVLQE